MKAIIPAAGLGTRFLPATKAVPKEMLPVLTKPTIQYVVEEALAASADEVVIVSNDQKPAIELHFSSNEALVSHLEEVGKPGFAAAVKEAGDLPVSFVEQAEALGLGHAVMMASDKVLKPGGGDAGDLAPEPFYVLLGDVLVPDNTILPRMLSISKEHGNASVIAVFKVPHEQVNRFGVISGETIGAEGDVWRVTGLVEKPPIDEAPTDLAIFGRYLLSPRVMELLFTTTPGAGGEIQLTDAMIELLKYEEMYALVIDENEGFDVGTIESWLTTNMILALRDPELKAAIFKAAHPASG